MALQCFNSEPYLRNPLAMMVMGGRARSSASFAGSLICLQFPICRTELVVSFRSLIRHEFSHRYLPISDYNPNWSPHILTSSGIRNVLPRLLS